MTKPAFAPHKLSQEQITALHNNVLIVDMEFDTRITQSGLILANDNGTSLGIRPRWGRVYAVGKKQKDVKVGQWICVAHGRWTRGLDIDDGTDAIKRTLRKIDPRDILLVSDSTEKPQDDTMSGAIHVSKQTRD
jgi:co-chaperonin GroES (HSP10)